MVQVLTGKIPNDSKVNAFTRNYTDDQDTDDHYGTKNNMYPQVGGGFQLHSISPGERTNSPYTRSGKNGYRTNWTGHK